jgi:hypothetical protein
MPTPTIPDGKLFMNATLYTGTGATQNITNGVAGQSFQPDLVWIKNRSSTNAHQLTDSVRGVNLALASDLTIAEFTGNINAFNANGFQLTGATNAVNSSGQTYVGWQWKAGGAAVTNTDGTISSQVSANTTSGFSVVTYTGNGTGGATIGHGLGAKPSFFIIKKRTNSGTEYGWYCYSSVLGATNHLVLNTTAGSSASSFLFNDTEPTSVAPYVFTVGTSPATNEISIAYVAYCWAAVPGYSAFGSYTGNGSTDGPFVYTGFRPRLVLVKESSSAGNNWVIYDTARDTFNECSKILYPNASNAEFDGSTVNLDILSNGFKPRDNWGGNNNSGSTYIYMAFAENPFKYANAR